MPPLRPRAPIGRHNAPEAGRAPGPAIRRPDARPGTAHARVRHLLRRPESLRDAVRLMTVLGACRAQEPYR